MKLTDYAISYNVRTACRSCKGTDLLPFLDLEYISLNGPFIAPPAEEVTFPFVLKVCLDCWLVQLLDEVKPDLLFTSVAYTPTIEQVASLQDYIAHLQTLAEDDTLALDIFYLPYLLFENRFDALTHKRLSYFSLASLAHLLLPAGFKILDVKELPTESYIEVIVAKRTNKTAVSENFKNFIEDEMKMGLNEPLIYEGFEQRLTYATIKRDRLAQL